MVFNTQRIVWPREIRLDCITNCLTDKSRKSYTFLKLRRFFFNGEIFKGNYTSLRAIPLRNTTQYLGCQLDSKLNGKALASNALRKINAKLKFLYQKSIYLIPAFGRLLCNALIQPHLCMFFMTSSFRKKLKIKLKKTQHKYICFCLNLPPRSRIDPTHIRKTKLRPGRDRVEHCIVKTIFKS